MKTDQAERKTRQRDYMKQWRAKHPDAVKRYAEKRRLRSIEWYRRNSKCVNDRKRSLRSTDSLYREKANRIAREWYRANTSRSRAAKLWNKYRIKEDELLAMLKAQGSKCAICSKEGRLDIDHDHSTGAVRALLCVNCNWGIGRFFENPELLRTAALYLEKFNTR